MFRSFCVVLLPLPVSADFGGLPLYALILIPVVGGLLLAVVAGVIIYFIVKAIYRNKKPEETDVTLGASMMEVSMHAHGDSGKVGKTPKTSKIPKSQRKK